MPFYIHKENVSVLYKLKMKLHPHRLYPPHTDISLEDCRAILRTTFVDALEDAISKHLELISKISDIEVVSGQGGTGEEGAEDQTGSKSADGEDNTVGGGDASVGENEDDEEDDDDNEDQGADAEKRKKQICDEMEYDDGMEKKTSVVVDQLDGECQSGFESEVDQAEVEAEEDFEVRGDDVGSVADEKAFRMTLVL